MRGSRGTVALVAATIAVAAWPGVAAAVPVKGAYYVGTAPGKREPTFISVSRDGRSLATYVAVYEVACSDGSSRSFAYNHVQERRIGVASDGSFDAQLKRYRISDGKGKRRISGVGTARLTGRFDGDQATLTIRNQLRGTVTCDQDVTVPLRRVGSPLQPAADGVMTTGRYTFRRARGVTVAPLRTVGPARLVNGLRISWRVRRCSTGARYRNRYLSLPLLLDPRGTVNLTESLRVRAGRGEIARIRARLTLRFSRAGTRYRVSGSWAATTRFYRGKRQVDTCRLSRRTFSGSAR